MSGEGFGTGIAGSRFQGNRGCSEPAFASQRSRGEQASILSSEARKDSSPWNGALGMREVRVLALARLERKELARVPLAGSP